MPTEPEVIDQLTQYGRWLESELSTELTYVPRSAVELIDVSVEKVKTSGHIASSPAPVGRRVGSSRLSLVAALLVLIGGVAVLSRFGGPNDDVPAVADQPVPTVPMPERTDEPDDMATAERATEEPLFVLPASMDPFDAAEFERTPLRSGDVGSAILIGRPTDWGFEDVSWISLVDELSFGELGIKTTIAGRSVQVADYLPTEPNPPIAFQDASGRWVEMGPARIELRETLLAGVSVVDEQLVFETTDGLETLQRFDRLETGLTRFVSFSTPTGGGLTIAVRSNPYVGKAPIPLGDAERILVRGREAYIAHSSPLPGFDVEQLTWLEQSGQVISISTFGDIDPTEAAEGLRIVDEASWIDELDVLPALEREDSAIGYPLGTVVLTNEDGQSIEFPPNGVTTILVAGTSTCVQCLADLDAIADLVAESPVELRAIAIRLDPDDLEWADNWPGPVATLPSSSGPWLTEPLTDNGILVLDGDNRTVGQFELDSQSVVTNLRGLLTALE